jgi:hypothetical protein
MSPSDPVRAAPHPSETISSLSSKCRRASATYLRDREHARIRQIRSRARKERELICKLHVRCVAPSARHLLKQALQTVDLVDRYFLSKGFLQERKGPAQLSKWFDFVELCLENAVKKREFYETMLERYYPLLHCSGRTARGARQQSAFGSRLAGSRGETFAGGYLKVEPRRRSRGRGDGEFVDARPLSVAADAMSISPWSSDSRVRSAGGSRRAKLREERLKSRLAKDDPKQ